MLDRKYADIAWEQAAALLAIDSPTGFTAKAAAWVKNAFEAMGYPVKMTKKGGVLADLGGEGRVCCWRPIRTPWAAWWRRSRATAACG